VTLTWTNVGVAVGWAAAAALCAWLITWPVRRRSFGWLMFSVTLTSTAASTGALLGAVHSMLLPTGDEPQLVVLTLAAGLLALTGAIEAARRLGRDHRGVTEAIAELGRGRIPSEPQPGLTRDVAALQHQVRHTAAALHDSREREQALEASRRELVSWVSHDLRTPLAGLRAMTEALEDGVAEDPELYYKQIGAAVDRLTGMVDDLFDLSRIQAGAFGRVTQPVQLDELVSDCVGALGPLAAAGGVVLAGSSERGVVVQGSAAELTRALTNVIANAIRHTPDGGRVDVLLSTGDGTAHVAVSDGCGGIAPEILPRVFDVGFRGSSARTTGTDDGRAGLGLAVTRGIVEAHDGMVAVENTEVGCRFSLQLLTR
jgi:signal transduction histidine kinase